MYLHLWNTWIDNESFQIEEVDFGSNDIYVFPFSLFVSVYVYACVCDSVGIALLLPFILEFRLSVFFLFLLLKKIFFLIIIFILITFILFYFTILFYFILSSFFLSFFLFPFYSEPCWGQALGAPARREGCATGVGEPSSEHWSTRDLPAPRNIKRQKSPRDLHLNAKTQLHSTTSKLQCWTRYAKQLARQEHNPIQ